MYRLAALVSHPIQYFAPLFRYLAQQPQIDLTVYFCSRLGLEERLDPGFGRVFKWDMPLLDGYHCQFLPNLRGEGEVNGFFRLINPGIIKELRNGHYDALWIHGYAHATNWLAALAALRYRVPFLVRGESNLLRPRSWAKSCVKRAVLRWLFQHAAGCLYIGTLNKQYYQHYGVPEQKLFFTPYSVDNDFLQRQWERLKPQRHRIRRRFGFLDERPVILFCGKLIHKKRPDLLLAAYAEIRHRRDCGLLFVGDGELRKHLNHMIRAMAIPDVIFTGFLNQSQITEAYAAADIFVLPSAWDGGGAETWGLVVNEAMNFGLAIIVSDRVGCAPDLVSEDNGLVVPYDSKDDLITALETLVVDENLRSRMGEASLTKIANWGIPQTADGIIQALETISGTKRNQP